MRQFSFLLPAATVLLCFAFYFSGGDAARIGVPLCLGASLVTLVFSGRRNTTLNAAPPEESPKESAFPNISQKQVDEETGVVQIAALGSEHRRTQWQNVETKVDEILDDCIKLIRARIDAHTVAVFFPTLDGGFKLRRYSSNCEFINREAVIYPGVGVIGGFLKDGLKQLNLKEIMSDSMTLYYYNKDAGIRSLMASPIIAGGTERGTIIVDSTNKKNFSDEDHAYLALVASLLGQAVFSTYLCTEHKLEHIRLAAMSSIEKEFFRNLSLDHILDKMTEIIPFAIACDRLTISIRSEDGKNASILRAWGNNAEFFKNRQFSLKDKNLAALTYAKNLCLSRNYSKEYKEIKYFDDEPRDDEEFNSFLAVPVGVDECKGLILVESLKRNAFGDSCKELLSRIATSAGLAIEKIMIFEKARELATHDGLTGLYNHRQFQQILKDEITRALRYNDPLTLIICDIDYFKKVNDTWGHQFGDTVLKGVASHLNESIRQGVDTASRYGGEEFALVLVKTDLEGAIETAERIRSQIHQITFKAPSGEDVHVSMSLGIAAYRQHARHIDELIKKADKALYRAKENGRNRVEVF